MNPKQSEAGLSLTELIVLLAVIALVSAIFLPSIAERRRPYGGQRIKCVNNLKNVGLAYRIFATDNNDKHPHQLITTSTSEFNSLQALDVFQFLSNELSTPKILHCPTDTRVQGSNFATVTSKNISYFASLTTSETSVASFLAGDRNMLTDGQPVGGLLTLTTNIAATLSWSQEMHVEQGDIAMADGSVQQMSSSRLKHSIRDQDLQTNYLAFP